VRVKLLCCAVVRLQSRGMESIRAGAGVGTLILRSPAYVHVISSEQQSSVCDGCLATPNVLDNVHPSQLQKCSRCRQSYYCDVSCQKRAWPQHKQECKYLKKIQPRVPPSIVKLILRMAFKHRTHPDYKETLPDGSSRGLTDLKMHAEEISSSGERSEAFSSFLQVIVACLTSVGESFSAESLFAHYCRLVINSTELTDMMGGRLGTALYLGLSAVDHSCQPNVNVVFSGSEVELRALAEIPAPVWSNARLSYLNTVLPRSERRARLRSAYYFTCLCDLCTQTDDGLCAGSVLCAQCEAPVALQQDKCSRCAHLRTEDILTGTEIFFQDLDNLQLIKAYKILKRKFHIFDHRMFEFSERVMAACLNEGEFGKFYEVGEAMLPAYRKYFPPKSVSLGLHLAKLAKMAIYLNRTEAALAYLGQASDILKVSHGQNSPMMAYMMSVRATLSV